MVIENSRSKAERTQKEILERMRLPAVSVYKIIAFDGHEELSRPLSSLIWSGIAAGICISLSVIASGVLNEVLPREGSWHLVQYFGYTLGFLVVIQGRLQLFTENTITAVLPTLANFSTRNVTKMLRVWGVVFGANMIGTFIIALLLTLFVFLPPEYMEGIMRVSYHYTDIPPMSALVRGIPTGLILASMVWIMPSCKGQETFTIIILIYLIALGEFTHVVAGSVEIFLVIFDSGISVLDGLLLLFSTALGNIIGGTGLFALLVYAQIREEI